MPNKRNGAAAKKRRKEAADLRQMQSNNKKAFIEEANTPLIDTPSDRLPKKSDFKLVN